MKYEHRHTRRLAAILGAGAAAVAAPIVIFSGALGAGTSLGSEEPSTPSLEPTESTPSTTFSYVPPTEQPENPGAPGNPGDSVGDQN